MAHVVATVFAQDSKDYQQMAVLVADKGGKRVRGITHARLSNDPRSWHPYVSVLSLSLLCDCVVLTGQSRLAAVVAHSVLSASVPAPVAVQSQLRTVKAAQLVSGLMKYRPVREAGGEFRLEVPLAAQDPAPACRSLS